MADQSRQTKVLMTLIASMLIGAAVLNSLSNNPLSASAFCLSRYYRLAPVEESVGHRFTPYQGRWRRIEIFYNNDAESHGRAARASDKFAKLAEPSGRLIDSKHDECHFVVCNGHLASDGQIHSTENWQSQRPVSRSTSNRTKPATPKGRTIYICISTDRENTAPTDSQVRRTEALVEELCRRFDIHSKAIFYPGS